MGYKNLIFGINIFFPLKHGFGMFLVKKFHNNSFRCLVVLVAFPPRGSLRQPSISICDILVSETLQIFMIFSSISYETPDILTLLQRPHCSLFDSCFFQVNYSIFQNIVYVFDENEFTDDFFIGTHKTFSII